MELAVKTTFESVSADSAVVSGVSVVTVGEAKGHGVFIDARTLESVKECADAFTNGVKVKVDHGSGFADIVGSLKNFRIVGDQLKADLHLLSSHKMTAQILEIASKFPDNFGLSISFSSVPEEVGGKMFARCGELFSVDLVDDPAANPTGLFSNKIDSRKITMTFEAFIDRAKKVFNFMEPEAEADPAPVDEKPKHTCPECGTEFMEGDEEEPEVIKEGEAAMSAKKAATELADATKSLDAAKLDLAASTERITKLEAELKEATEKATEFEAKVTEAGAKKAAEINKELGVPAIDMKETSSTGRVEVKAREIDEYRNLKGTDKTQFWKANKAAIIAQGKAEEKNLRG